MPGTSSSPYSKNRYSLRFYPQPLSPFPPSSPVSLDFRGWFSPAREQSSDTYFQSWPLSQAFIPCLRCSIECSVVPTKYLRSTLDSTRLKQTSLALILPPVSRPRSFLWSWHHFFSWHHLIPCLWGSKFESSLFFLQSLYSAQSCQFDLFCHFWIHHFFSIPPTFILV